MGYWAVHGNWFARVNALHNILRKKSRKFAAATSRPISEWALLHAVYRTVEVELRIAKQHKCHYCCVCKNYRGESDGGWEKSVFASFFGWPENSECVKKACVLLLLLFCGFVCVFYFNFLFFVCCFVCSFVL